MNLSSNRVYQIWVLEKLPSPFLSVDSTAPASYSSAEDLRKVLLSEKNDMYELYTALFALRNNGEKEVIPAIIESLGSKSALLRHEVAYGSKSTNNVVMVVVQDGDGGQGWKKLVDVVVVVLGRGGGRGG
ncbi:Deoxyhypusine hydroxylase [Capsicum chinense]|nr:Deoxyhypusine hydroxylase [Capsicum chinense]